MTTGTLTLTDFLMARIAEDETFWRREEDDLVMGGVAARMLAECEAKRNLVNYAAFMLKAWEDKAAGAYPDMNRRERHTARIILDQLGAVYADHPDYRESWRP